MHDPRDTYLALVKEIQFNVRYWLWLPTRVYNFVFTVQKFVF
jgi:hypothetical protein